MIAIFGPPELDRLVRQPEKDKSELHKAVDGSWWSNEAKSRSNFGMRNLKESSFNRSDRSSTLRSSGGM